MTATYENIATTTLVTATNTITFSSISGSFTDIIVMASYPAPASNMNAIRLRFNSDTGSNYSHTFLEGTGSVAQSGRASSQTYLQIGYQNTAGAGNFISQIQNYSNTTTNKTAITRFSHPASEVGAYVGLWRSISAIDAIEISCQVSNFPIGSTFTLYGIKAE
jgi:hypothetical protein